MIKNKFLKILLICGFLYSSLVFSEEIQFDSLPDPIRTYINLSLMETFQFSFIINSLEKEKTLGKDAACEIFEDDFNEFNKLGMNQYRPLSSIVYGNELSRLLGWIISAHPKEIINIYAYNKAGLIAGLHGKLFPEMDKCWIADKEWWIKISNNKNTDHPLIETIKHDDAKLLNLTVDPKNYIYVTIPIFSKEKKPEFLGAIRLVLNKHQCSFKFPAKEGLKMNDNNTHSKRPEIKGLKIDYLSHHPEWIPLIAQWTYSTWHQYDPTLTLERSLKSINTRLNTDKVPLTLVAIHNDKPIGTVNLKKSVPVQNVPENKIWLGSFYV